MRGTRGVKRLLPLILLAVLAGDVASRRPAAAEERPAERDFRTEFQQSFTAVPDLKSLTVRGNVYVPAYSTIRGRSDRPGELSTLLRIDNTSSTKPLVLERIDYFDTGGKLVQRYLNTPAALKPLGSIQIFVPASDNRGGPAANFIVTWAGAAPIAEPLVESVIFGKIDGEGYSFVSPGRTIKNVGKRPWLSFGLSR